MFVNRDFKELAAIDGASFLIITAKAGYSNLTTLPINKMSI